MANEFDRNELQRYYSHNRQCRITGKHNATAFHHAIGRANRHSNTLINATPVHNETHLARHGEISRQEWVEYFIKENIKFLLKEGYTFTQTDKDFIVEHNLDHILEEL